MPYPGHHRSRCEVRTRGRSPEGDEALTGVPASARTSARCLAPGDACWAARWVSGPRPGSPPGRRHLSVPAHQERRRFLWVSNLTKRHVNFYLFIVLLSGSLLIDSHQQTSGHRKKHRAEGLGQHSAWRKLVTCTLETGPRRLQTPENQPEAPLTRSGKSWLTNRLAVHNTEGVPGKRLPPSQA